MISSVILSIDTVGVDRVFNEKLLSGILAEEHCVSPWTRRNFQEFLSEFNDTPMAKAPAKPTDAATCAATGGRIKGATAVLSMVLVDDRQRTMTRENENENQGWFC
jgi:hypothetical protein